MTANEPGREAAHGSRSPASSSLSAPTRIGITVYGCGQDEAACFTELAPHFGVTPTLVAAAVSQANIELASGNRCISVDHKTSITRPLLWALSRAGVTYISTRSAGCNHIDVQYAESLGMTVGTVAYSPDSVADYTLMLMLMAARDAKSMLLRGSGHDYRLNAARGKELRDLTVRVVGTGRIGTAVLDRLKGFGCRVLAHDRHARTSARYVSFDELILQSDIVSLHTPLTPATHHLIDRRRIEQMKRGAFLINTGRGALVDTEALIDALESGTLGGAALDVLEGEEGAFYLDCSSSPAVNSLLLRLQRMPNVVISPHIAYYTDHALTDIVVNTLSNCLEFEKETLAWIG